MLLLILQRDCCETCYRAQTTTPAPTTTPVLCENEWADATCEQLADTLGDCGTIQVRICVFHLVGPGKYFLFYVKCYEHVMMK